MVQDVVYIIKTQFHYSNKIVQHLSCNEALSNRGYMHKLVHGFGCIYMTITLFLSLCYSA